MQQANRLILFCSSDLEEAALPLEKYASLRDFFVRALKEGSRPIDPDPYCLVTGNKILVHFTCPSCFLGGPANCFKEMF